MTTTFNRVDLERAFPGNKKLIQAFESIRDNIALVRSIQTANVDSTKELQDATYVTLSSNDALPNERVLAVDGTGLYIQEVGGFVVIGMLYPIVTNAYALNLNLLGDTAVNLPISGTIPSSAVGPYTNDADAAANGVAVGEIYKGPAGLVTWRQV